MSRRTLFTAIVGLFVMSVVSIMPTRTAVAAATTGSITIAPISFELYANPGESLTEKIRVRNDSGADNTYQILVEDFKAVGEEGSVDLMDDQSNTTYSLAKWVVPEPKNISVKNGAEKEISFTINVPKDAEPGGHYASVLAEMGASGAQVQSGATVASKVGSLILLRVAGNVKENANIESFKANKYYYEKSPVSFELRVKDNGNNHINPTGTILITNLFGQKVAEIPLNGKNVLPGAIRKMDTDWSFSKLLANRYTATLVANYGQQNQTLSATTTFIVFPKPFAIALLIVVILIVLAILNKKKFKRFLHKLTK